MNHHINNKWITTRIITCCASLNLRSTMASNRPKFHDYNLFSRFTRKQLKLFNKSFITSTTSWCQRFAINKMSLLSFSLPNNRKKQFYKTIFLFLNYFYRWIFSLFLLKTKKKNFLLVTSMVCLIKSMPIKIFV